MKNSMKIAIIAGLVAVVAMGAVLVNQTKTASALAEAEKMELELKIQNKISEAEKLYQGYYYDEAIELLKSDPSIITETTDDAITLKIEEIEQAKASLVKYEGPVHHVFFHSLIIYPNLAFDNKGHPAQGYNMWMTTVSEFKKMLPNLQKRGYVLYSLEDYIEPDPETPENIKLKDIYLPPGKIPLVISIDDVNYYDYMKPDGFANRLVLGDDGRVWTEVITPQGEVKNTRDGDVMPILDDYVAEHPEFSYRGAKGTIALTGYQGALGYRITDGLPEEEKWQQEVKKIAETLKADGWSFACHSYTHNGYFRDGTITLAQMKYDTDRWIQKIAPYVGKTNIYISPFGAKFKKDDPRYRYLIDQGYQIYCPVGNDKRIIFNSDNIVMPRVNLDGYTMYKRPDEMSQYYFEVPEVIDESRPPLEIQ
ncbi:polysaccharide deacetylase [Sinanaerobacter chloroacetimidivorans]|uniref:Polysaccharide deacetylase n=1 Tax=Sinanaerobacter chloroacetimidivorans TaxID=2818044 RepID=A0A8J8B1Z2_9FIRM|nr:polysaccharide deacetylase [Sinanaerobacter chloroacetimidivorans]MBR0598196.1 polysaccharide deacetylase [Sinanaerobacter chloroacetimidivorans]